MLHNSYTDASFYQQSPARTQYAPFSLVLTGGGANGLAHIDALQALEHYQLIPSAVVGVSMGAIIGTVYALNPDWYAQLRAAQLDVFSQPLFRRNTLRERAQTLATARRIVAGMVTGWGVGAQTLAHEWSLLHRLTRLKHLEEGRMPLAATATDLGSGERIVLQNGDAAKAIYASSAMPGVFPPLEWQGHVLSDGGFTDNAPVDVARELFAGPVVVVNVGHEYRLSHVHNGATALYQAVQSGLDYHTNAQLQSADLVLHPDIGNAHVLDFAYPRPSIVAGAKVVRQNLPALRNLLEHRTSYGDTGATVGERPETQTYNVPQLKRLAPDRDGAPSYVR